MAKKFQISVDRISALPDEALCHIIFFLPTIDAVQTAVLSMRWRYLFGSTSNLNFEFKNDSRSTLDPFINFVDRVLFLCKRPTIDRFRLHCSFPTDHPIDCPLRVDGWIREVLCRSIREPDLSIPELNLQDELTKVLFVCKTLVVLRLTCIKLQVPAMVRLPSLKVLHLHCEFESDFGELPSTGCPVREDLNLAGYYAGKSRSRLLLDVSNDSLKRLTMFTRCLNQGCTSEVIINVKSLVYLNYTADADQTLSIINMSSLTGARIDTSSLGGHGYHPSATHIMNGISDIRILYVSYETLCELYEQSVSLPSFLNLTYLVADVYSLESFIGLVCLLQHSNFLETLVLEVLCFAPDLDDYPESWLEVEYDKVPHSHLSRLKAIEILKFCAYYEAKAEVEIVKYFLRNAVVLENLTIRINGAEEKQRLSIAEDLLMFPRVSKKCQVRIV